MEIDNEDLISPTMSTTLRPLPRPSRSPTKEDVERAEYLMNMVRGNLSCKRTVVCGYY
ncbi:hypothetical protein V1525DRAFT_397211 [Lipomyces kononenkoae]|uniref:Uncharacterized protein n=1 Tax=Lipomyces kononenkoae TaxID=34357 RepID=A0ACC3T7A1_LIPKO